MPRSISDHQEAVDGTDSLRTLIEDDGLSDSQEPRYGAPSLTADMDSYYTDKPNREPQQIQGYIRFSGILCVALLSR